MESFNLFRGETSEDEGDPPGFRARSAQLGPILGASRLGMTVYEVPPGQAVCPYIWGRQDEALDHMIRRSPELDYYEGEQ